MEIQLTGQNKAQASRKFSKKLLMLTVAGGAAFWMIDFVIAVSPIAAQYKAAFSISSLPVALVEAFAGGMLIALWVSFFLLRFFDRIPDKKTIFKTLLLIEKSNQVQTILRSFHLRDCATLIVRV